MLWASNTQSKSIACITIRHLIIFVSNHRNVFQYCIALQTISIHCILLTHRHRINWQGTVTSNALSNSRGRHQQRNTDQREMRSSLLWYMFSSNSKTLAYIVYNLSRLEKYKTQMPLISLKAVWLHEVAKKEAPFYWSINQECSNLTKVKVNNRPVAIKRI